MENFCYTSLTLAYRFSKIVCSIKLYYWKNYSQFRRWWMSFQLSESSTETVVAILVILIFNELTSTLSTVLLLTTIKGKLYCNLLEIIIVLIRFSRRNVRITHPRSSWTLLRSIPLLFLSVLGIKPVLPSSSTTKNDQVKSSYMWLVHMGTSPYRCCSVLFMLLLAWRIHPLRSVC